MDLIPLIVYLMVRFCAPESLSCAGTRQPGGSFFYQVTRPLPSSRCQTCWEDENRTVIARDLNFDRVLVLKVTDSSIELKACRQHLHFIQECAESIEETDCRVNCSWSPEPVKTCLFGNWCPSVPILFSFGILPVLGIICCVCIYKCRRRSAATRESYVTGYDQVKVTRVETVQ